jgi:hypothetical protein
MAMSNICLASWIGSRGRFGMIPSCHIPRPTASARDFKLRHYPTGSGLVFEDKNGTLRIIQQLPCTLDGTPNGPPRVIAEIRRR